MTPAQIIKKLPYQAPFLFVDELHLINENEVKGNFTFGENLDFYKGHFINNPVTPGVILIETMAQIGLVSLGIYLTQGETINQIAFTSSEVEFLLPIYPNETVVVESIKIYYRFGKLKCHVKLYNQAGNLACEGTLAGIIKIEDHG